MDNPESKPNEETVDLADVTIQDSNGDVIPTGAEEKPAGLPEGIESLEQLIDRYNDLVEQSKGEKPTEPQEEPKAEEPGGDDDQEDEDEPEVDERDERIKALEIKLHDQELVRQVGGEEEYNQLREWASKNIEADELDFYNNVLDSSDLAAKKLAVKAMQAIYRDSAGYEGKQVSGSNAQVTSNFKSEGELHEAMADPRYHRMDSIGEAYREEVSRRAMALLSGPSVNGWY
ncbi:MULTISPECIES: hypothetical protein [unclassified Marinobacter]|uniref:hypothetical protein n=1 Tax=unclassified Marinobacter TaxID=83889 RepID=UPI00126799BE|nr:MULTISPECIES: hypothetical protein [unclassified Marinobacter]QFS87593.1 hypothetical protein FIV08_12240 [Marinobacter sp. THAF197a]QFT51378.1 hypothetical protein FIU96_12155 [Marinobacter sp. THAF39]